MEKPNYQVLIHKEGHEYDFDEGNQQHLLSGKVLRLRYCIVFLTVLLFGSIILNIIPGVEKQFGRRSSAGDRTLFGKSFMKQRI